MSWTYLVEGDNVEVRHYLARLGRKSRSFSCSLEPLYNTGRVFVYAWNRRQLYKQPFFHYPAHSFQFISP